MSCGGFKSEYKGWLTLNFTGSLQAFNRSLAFERFMILGFNIS